MLSKCVFYRPEHTANWRPVKLNFDGLGMQRWNKPTNRTQRVDEKVVFICLFIRIMVINMSNNDSFSYFMLTTAKN